MYSVWLATKPRSCIRNLCSNMWPFAGGKHESQLSAAGFAETCEYSVCSGLTWPSCYFPLYNTTVGNKGTVPHTPPWLSVPVMITTLTRACESMWTWDSKCKNGRGKKRKGPSISCCLTRAWWLTTKRGECANSSWTDMNLICSVIRHLNS